MTVDSLFLVGVRQLWQVSVLIVSVTIVLSLIGRKRPHLAYAVWLVILVKCVTPPIWSSVASPFSWILARPAAAFSEAAASDGGPLSLTASSPRQMELPKIELVTRPALRASTYKATGLATPSDPKAKTVNSVIELCIRQGPLILFIVWLVGAVSSAGYFVLKSLQWRQVLAQCREVDAATMHTLKTLTLQQGLRNPPKLKITESPRGPAVIGFIHPTIVLPGTLVAKLSNSELRAILCHELSHIRRNDVAGAWLQVAAACIWWFYPLVWFANRQLTRSREATCDEEVIARLGISPRSYGEAILAVLESRLEPVSALAAGISASEKTEDRLRRLMEQKKFSERTPSWCWALASIVGVLFIPGAALPEAQRTEIAQQDSKAKNTVTERDADPTAEANISRLPVLTDDTDKRSPQHQAATARLRELGARVQSTGEGSNVYTQVQITQYWKGSPADMRLLRKLDSLTDLRFRAEPRTAPSRNAQRIQSPVVTTEWLHNLGELPHLQFVDIQRSELSDADLAFFGGWRRLRFIRIGESRVRGKGMEALSGLPIHDLFLSSDELDMERVDLSGLRQLNRLSLNSNGEKCVLPAKVGSTLRFVSLHPTTEASMNSLKPVAAQLESLCIGGASLTDEVLHEGSEAIRAVKELQITKCRVSDAGLIAFTDSKLERLYLRRGVGVTDAAIEHLAKINSLREVHASGVFRFDEVAKLMTANPRVVVFGSPRN